MLLVILAPALAGRLRVVVDPRDALGEAHRAIRLGVPRDFLLRFQGVLGVLEGGCVVGEHASRHISLHERLRRDAHHLLELSAL